ncbi:MAG: transporter substrate-binding domain-containing protein [bacterium]|nr:transporter substrate-binding domain-containing protein [bacterium]
MRPLLNPSFKLLGLLWVLTFFGALTLAAEPTLILGTPLSPPLSTVRQDGAIDLIVKEAFKRIGREVTYQILPGQRSLLNAVQGIDDGDLFRVKGIEDYFPNIVRVPEKLLDFEFVAFTNVPEINPQGFEEINVYSVGMVNGWKILERATETAQERILVESSLQLMNLLRKGRIEIALYERYEGLAVVHQLRPNDIRVIEPPLIVKEGFFYLNKKHQALVLPLARALREMKADGSFQQLWEQGLRNGLK